MGRVAEHHLISGRTNEHYTGAVKGSEASRVNSKPCTTDTEFQQNSGTKLKKPTRG